MLSQSETLSRLAARRPDYALEQALYCDPGVYALDLENVFYREWLFAVPSCELPKAGAFATLQVGAYPLVITRGNDGMIRAFHNVCRHRGQRLCAKETGSTPKLVCPYHQWTYDLDGKLLYARDMQEGFDPAAHGLKKVHCVDLGGMVFICLAEVPPPISDLAPKLMSYLAPSGLKDAKVAFSSTIVENGNWKLVIENNRECYHCGGSHPSLCRTYSDNPRMTAMEGPDSASPDILDHWKRCEAAGLPSRFVNHPDMQWRLARIPLLNNAESYTMSTKAAVAKRMGAMPFNDAGSLLFFHYPNTWNHFLGDHAIVFRILPISPTETEVTTKWLVHKDAVEGVDYDLETLTRVWLNTNDEDRQVVEENQKGILSPAYEPGPYSTIQEEGVIQFVDWYCNVMSKRLAPKPALAAE
ncbi:aromatic ring-hydroxylating dioxygenase subunit alpha (plasmid) [Gemmobacter fulvus]|uniref:Aromatic ring-hydroxylating dioxygenase subunit alpha n=1 Tax=Gemmobacter fulvus TaxID=2840474 RepID=A0A975S415_9RHOB|nr:aromatic ring-hydroxylating dioxygenase subunit alpha [Gemmobacter fulvus]MBT9246506.1 aromatic ring-hydroxylating dioxygenase subunit alpha [Gemmobacter fulvus]MDQ1849686.1 aromatic ring-hydroxylating dioxygenase subunit alpha [Gemmobacter fulvus]QWK92603.1 aromatic ring-hydroxylating dioxygenase subunit alpha [Gemmobacter fulvus]